MKIMLTPEIMEYISNAEQKIDAECFCTSKTIQERILKYMKMITEWCANNPIEIGEQQVEDLKQEIYKQRFDDAITVCKLSKFFNPMFKEQP